MVDRVINIRVVTGPAVGSVRNLEQALRSLDTAAIGVQSRLNGVFNQGFRGATPVVAGFNRTLDRTRQTIGGFSVPVLGLNTALGGTRRGFLGAGQAAQESGGQFTGLERTMRRLLVTTGAIAVTFRGLQFLFGSLDEFNELQNRLRLVTDGQEELNSATRDLFAISRDTRTAFSATATVYSRTALAAKDLNLENERLLRFTRSINQAAILSGAGEQERRAGLIQLSQGIASNTLRGDELRSVLENIPLVADVIAQSLGATRGELRELAREGQLTAEVILNAFEEAGPQLERQFGNTVPTLSQAVTDLGTAWTEFISGVDNNIGATRGLATVITFLANNVGLLTTAFVGLAGVIALSFSGTILRGLGIRFGFLATRIAATATAVGALTATLLRNPFTAIAVALTGVIATVIEWREELGLANRQHREAVDSGFAWNERVMELTESTGSYSQALREVNEQIRTRIQLENLARQDPNAGFDEVTEGLEASVSTPTSRVPGLNALDTFRNNLDNVNDTTRQLGETFQNQQDVARARIRQIDSDSFRGARIDALVNRRALTRAPREEEDPELPTRPGFASDFSFGNIAESFTEQTLRIQRLEREAFEEQQRLLEERTRALGEFYQNSVFAPLEQGFSNFVSGVESSLTDALRQIGAEILQNLGRQALSNASTSVIGGLLGTGAGAGFANFFVPGAQAGGTFRVRGAPGVDSNLLRVSRGEEVTVRNLDQQRQDRERAEGNRGRPIVIQLGADNLRPLFADEVRAQIREERAQPRRRGR